MTVTNNKTVSVTIGGKSVGGITKFTVRQGKEGVYVPSSEIEGAFVYVIRDVHYIEIERQVYGYDGFSNLHSLSNFTVVASCGGTTIRYSGCEIENIYEFYEAGGKISEKLRFTVDKRSVV